jgi:hypothetical protein
MAEMEFSNSGPAGSAPTALAPPPTFNAWMLRDAAIGALLAIGLGFGLLLIQLGLFPDVNLNRWMINAIMSLVSQSGMDNADLIGGALGGLLNIPITTDASSPFYMLQFVYAAFLSFPSNIAWLLGGIVVAFLRVRAGRDEGNLKAGWDMYWYAMLSIEIPFAVFGIMFLISSFTPELFIISAFAGSLLLYFLLFFLMPMFWLGLIFALLGSMIGSVLARKK